MRRRVTLSGSASGCRFAPATVAVADNALLCYAGFLVAENPDLVDRCPLR